MMGMVVEEEEVEDTIVEAEVDMVAVGIDIKCPRHYKRMTRPGGN